MRAPDPGRFTASRAPRADPGPEPVGPEPVGAEPSAPLRSAAQEPGWGEDPPVIVLRRRMDGDREDFSLDEPLGYLAALPGRPAPVRIVVPNPERPFFTDLTSVPSWFTWLVPKSGRHLPAALIHDGLVPDRGDTGPTYVLEPPGPPVDRIDADVVLREAMFDTDVGVVRCYLVWATVSLASLWLGARRAWPVWLTWYFRAVTVLLVGAVLVLGYAATVELLGLPWPGFDVWWVPDGGGVAAWAGGVAGAVVVPCLIALLWGRYFPVAAIAGVALATLVHVTIAVAAVALAYQAAERVVGALRRGAMRGRPAGRRAGQRRE